MSQNSKKMLLKPRNVLTQQQGKVFASVGFLCFITLWFLWRSTAGTNNNNNNTSSENIENIESDHIKPVKSYPIRTHTVDKLVPAIAYSGPLKKPLEIVGTQVSCPERGVCFK